MTLPNLVEPVRYFEWALIILALSALATYCYAAFRSRSGHRSWSRWRTAGFTVGILIIVAALLPPLSNFAHQDARGHMLQHLMLGMFAPLGLVLAAPITLLLRTVNLSQARAIVSFLRSRLVSTISHPIMALLLNVGGMYLLYLTPLYSASMSNGLIHGLLQSHFIIAGCLFTWSIAGPDPGPARPTVMFRLGVLFFSMATHGILAKAMFAYGWPKGVGYPHHEIAAAAKIMYYGGDLAELLLLVALLVLYEPKWLKASKNSG